MTNSQVEAELTAIHAALTDLKERLNIILDEGDLNKEIREWTTAAEVGVTCTLDDIERAGGAARRRW